MTLQAQISPRVAALLEKARATRGRLIFAIDATASREATWDMAAQLQSAMFKEAAKIGSLDVQLVYYRGDGECRSSSWFSDAHELVKRMGAIRCEAGATQIGRVALRAWLKIGLRSFGLRCEELHEDKQQRRTTMVDARNYASKYIKPDNVRDSPLTTRIVNIYEDDRYGRLMLELENGSQFGLNDGNTNILIQAWGYDTDAWLEQELELSLGTYKDWRADPPADKETVRVKAISPRKTTAGNSGAPSKPSLPPSRTAAQGGPTSLRGEMDDEIPFLCEWR
jgi:hypothetical protein